MAAAPLESSSTPPDAPFVESTRPHGDPMEDSDPQSTRKRPRLDSGSRACESLSIDDAARATSTAPASSAMDETPDSEHPANKMTINTKSAASEMPPDMTADSLPDQGSVAEPQPDPDAIPANNVISLSSSPAPSPEIEVAELEDMDQDPNMSNWRPLEEALRDHAAPEVLEVQEPISLVDSFPKVRENLGARDNLERICIMLEKGDPNDAAAFIAVKHWMDDCVRNLGRLTHEVFAEDRDFWDEVPTLMEYLLRRGHDLQPVDGDGKWACFEEFFLDYARITLHLVHLDTLTLTQLSNEADIQAPESLSRPYLQPLTWMLQFHNIPFFRTLDRVYDDEVLNLLVRVRAQVAAPPTDAAGGLSEYASRAMALIPKCPQLAPMLTLILTVALCIVDGSLERKQKLAEESMPDSTASPPFLEPLYDMVRSFDEKYQEYITKKAPWVTGEMSEQMLRLIFRIYQCFCQRNPDAMNQLSRDLSIELPEGITLDDGIFILSSAWKFGVLKKHIIEGRMELRVLGVETMQSDLVNIWRQHLSTNPNGVALPFIQYLIRFIRDNKLVDYLVGIDSHPQLISRSSNIVGFLVVTSTYTDLDTDVIWKTVTESQDSRTVSEVLSMLMRTIPMHPPSSPALLYLCSKLLELPLDRFDMRMLDLCRNLLPNVREKPVDQGRFDPSDADHTDTIPLRLCVRLIRDSTATEDLSTEYKNTLQEFGSAELSQLIKAGLSETDKMEVYERCVQDIGEMNQFTAGSIRALNALVPIHDTSEIWKLATEFDLTRLVVTEMAHSMKEGHANFSGPSFEGFTSRVQMLARLIDMAPQTITNDLGNTLWNEVLTSKNLALQARRAIWNMLCTVTHRSARQNTFIERCIQEYLPQLRPEDYSPEVLAFAKQSINYEIRFNPTPSADEDVVVTIPGMDRIWNFILMAPPGSIETEATNYAIEVYLDHSIICNASPSSVEATHVGLVDRCVEYLKQAAATLRPCSSKAATGANGSMEIDSTDGDVGVAKLRFSRSLLFLRQLLHGLRTRPQYSTPQVPEPRLPERPLRGNPVDISYQWFNGNSSSQVSVLRIGDLSTAAELVEKLTQLTGFSKFTAYCGGQKVDLLESRGATVKDLNLSGLLILRKAAEAQEVTRGRRQSLTSVDCEVLKHFDELYELLDLEDNLARGIFDFLIVFPPQGRVRELVKSESNTEKDLFPLQRLFNALYSMATLSTCLREETLEACPSLPFVSHSIRVVVAFLTGDGVNESLAENPIKLSLVANAVDCLLLSFSVYQPVDDDAALVQEPAPLVERLLHLIDTGLRCSSDSVSATSVHRLTCNSFAVLVEGSLRDQSFWNAVKLHAQFDQLLLSLLLEEDRQPIRNEISERIKMTCSPIKLLKQPAKISDEESQPGSPTENPARIDMLATLWNAFIQIIPKAPTFARQSAEFFKVTLWVFRYIAEKSPQDLIFDDYLKQWSGILLSHRTDEFVGRELVDDLVLGFAHLLELCLDLADTANVAIDTFDLAERILGNYLFPELSPESDDPVDPQTPVMHTLTRQKLYNIVCFLCKKSDETYCHVLEQLESVVPRDYHCGTTWCFDRSKMVRAPEGYAGLKNLSNTCYLNSLLTQLFMNVEFREFMSGLHPADPDSSQKLLYETQRLFAWMQETWMKSIDSQDFVDSIRTYDNEPIDVTIQMDVDEFYNLLFDRWEAQVLDDAAKKKFRSFYGGQLVQQIKSKECSHISERMEPFSAIQCDIKGKASLEESLKAYVEGEVMQGDNKYSCTSCGRHVDAVKRACLKDVPDNLIFHLKRFDFDMVHMMRSKINDEFRFPQRIDMAPFKVEHLSDSNASVAPDIFELVGVLVHTGTAESGHYYSYIRERPTTDSQPSWVEFNDSDVSRFDPFTIPDQCFGGHGESGHSMGGVQINKVWNAYMLFYQRVSKMEGLRSVYKPAKRDVPVRVPVPTSLHNYIAMENEIFIRSYCLLDPYYTFFVQNLLRRLHSTAPGYADKLKLALLTIDIGMDTFEQVVARSKDHLGLDNIFTEIFRTYGQSTSAAYRTLQWVCERPTSIRNLILKSAHADIRGKATLLIVGALKELCMAVKDSSIEETEREIWSSRLRLAFKHIVSMLNGLWTLLQTVPRVWDDYFAFFAMLSELGSWAVGILMDTGVFLRCLEIIWLDHEDRMKLRGYYANYCRLIEKGRRFSHKKLMTLCSVFFKNIDLTLPPTAVEEDRTLTDGRFSLSTAEDAFIKPLEKDGGLSLLTKMLQKDHSSNPQATRNIISLFLHAEPEAGFLDPICKTLEGGLRVSPAELCGPFLDAAWVFCQHCPDEDRVIAMIDFVAKGVESINNSGGQEHLSFFTHLTRCFNDRVKMDRETFTEITMEKIPDWAPTLLIDTDKHVRQMTLNALQGLLFVDENDEMEVEEEFRSRCTAIGRELMQACVEKVRRSFLSGQVQTVESRLVEGMTNVILHCLDSYYDDSEEDQQIAQETNAILALLDEMTIEVPEDLISESDLPSPDEWEGNSALASDSELGLAGSP